MPFYDYQCKKCGHVFEVEHSIHADPKVMSEKVLRCPVCNAWGGQPGFERQIAGASFSLKGSGWGRDGYR